MSKSIRLKDHLVAEVERLAKEERRSLAQMVELLLEQALRLRPEEISTRLSSTGPRSVTVADAQPRDIPSREVKTDFK